MANIRSAIKRIATNNAANKRNTAQRSALRTTIKKFEQAAAKKQDNANELLTNAISAIDRAKSKGLIHKNKANRDKARLSAKLTK